ncbi:hypothetical protein VZT92_012581 [Zoarces viviparus]|uniref:Uncharacterized protein n=1 Tax=Zoarces viviparus TaxID=48416 RepID=A0AAW1F0C0_ZOAVI
MRLSKTTAALGFVDLVKGYFPHKFNTRANEYYIGSYPSPSYYGYNEMCDRDKPSFMSCLVHAFVANQNTNAHMMTESDTITRDKKQFHLRNATVFKKVQVVYNKRRLLSDYTTLPYGY